MPEKRKKARHQTGFPKLSKGFSKYYRVVYAFRQACRRASRGGMDATAIGRKPNNTAPAGSRAGENGNSRKSFGKRWSLYKGPGEKGVNNHTFKIIIYP